MNLDHSPLYLGTLHTLKNSSDLKLKGVEKL